MLRNSLLRSAYPACVVALLGFASCAPTHVLVQDDPESVVPEPEKKAEDKTVSNDTAKKVEPPKIPAEQSIKDAVQLRKLHKHDEALAVLKSAAALDPSPKMQAEILFRTGEVYFTKGQDAASELITGVESDACFREAIRVFSELPNKHPKEEITPEGVFLIGSSYLELDEFENALAAYSSAYTNFPSYTHRSRALMRVGVCQAGLDNPTAAREALQRCLKEFPAASVGESNKTRQYISEFGLIGLPAPSLQVTRWIDEIATDGIKTFRGEVVVLVFFATWCTHCKAELPHLRHLIETWGPKGATFLGISDPEDPKNTEPIDVYVKKYELPFVDVAYDTGSKCSSPYRVTGFPAGVIIDRKGVIRWRGHMSFFPTPLIGKLLEEK